MLKRYFALCALVIVACAPQRPATGPALWRLADADSEIWIMGTVHVLPPDLKWKSKRIEDAFARADTIWFETPTDEAATATIQALVRAQGFLPAGETLSSTLEPADRDRLARLTQALQIDRAQVETMRPWLAALQISMALLVQRGHAPDSGVEHVLETDARRLGKQTAYFETAEQQIGMLSGLPEETQRRFLVATLRQTEEEADQADAMDRLWAEGRADELGRLVSRLIEEAGPEAADAMIWRRNAAWAEDIDAMMRGSGRAFIAVGAAHLTGEKGVPALLRKKGYAVEGP